MALPTLDARRVRQLAMEAQGLSGPRPGRDSASILELVTRMGCLQLDPISVLAPSHLTVLWSRIGSFDTKELDRLLWEDRSLFHYWAHVASIVATSDFPIHSWWMRTRRNKANLRPRTREWLEANASIQRKVMSQIRARGPLRARDIAGEMPKPWESGGWSNEKSVASMIEFLWTQGRLAVAGRRGIERVWDLMDRWLPEWTPRETLPRDKVVELAALRAIGALGAATVPQIRNHFTRWRYPDLPKVMDRLVRRGDVEIVSVVKDGATLKGKWYVRTEDVERARVPCDRDGRTTLLSPFDNLICDRDRTELLWDFRYRVEIYVPRDKRVFGYYVLPILHGDDLVGRADLAVDRASATLRVVSLHAEEGAPAGAGPAIAEALHDLATFRGVERVGYPPEVPRVWKRALV